METMASFCGYEENVEELKNLLVQTIFALETTKRQANEDMRRNEENANQLLYFLEMACQERDEAREQLQKLQKLVSLGPAADVSHALSTLPPESLMISDVMSFGSSASQVDSLLDMVQSPDLSSIDNFGESSILGLPMSVSSYPVPQECIGNFSDSSMIGLPVSVPVLVSSNSVTHEYNGIGGIDKASLTIESLVRGKSLPEKGKLLQTVMEAGPLLKTLLVSGSLPQWRIPPPPPPPLQTYQMFPFSIEGYGTHSL